MAAESAIFIDKNGVFWKRCDCQGQGRHDGQIQILTVTAVSNNRIITAMIVITTVTTGLKILLTISGIFYQFIIDLEVGELEAVKAQTAHNTYIVTLNGYQEICPTIKLIPKPEYMENGSKRKEPKFQEM